jgi:hypothetical protein
MTAYTTIIKRLICLLLFCYATSFAGQYNRNGVYCRAKEQFLDIKLEGEGLSVNLLMLYINNKTNQSCHASASLINGAFVTQASQLNSASTFEIPARQKNYIAITESTFHGPDIDLTVTCGSLGHVQFKTQLDWFFMYPDFPKCKRLGKSNPKLTAYEHINGLSHRYDHCKYPTVITWDIVH